MSPVVCSAREPRSSVGGGPRQRCGSLVQNLPASHGLTARLTNWTFQAHPGAPGRWGKMPLEAVTRKRGFWGLNGAWKVLSEMSPGWSLERLAAGMSCLREKGLQIETQQWGCSARGWRMTQGMGALGWTKSTKLVHEGRTSCPGRWQAPPHQMPAMNPLLLQELAPFSVRLHLRSLNFWKVICTENLLFLLYWSCFSPSYLAPQDISYGLGNTGWRENPDTCLLRNLLKSHCRPIGREAAVTCLRSLSACRQCKTHRS